MLSITRETDYAIRAVCYLAKGRGRIIMTQEISREMDIPRTFLAKIIRKLVSAGIVQCFVGVKGGCRLMKEPEAISLLELIFAIEGPVPMNSCTMKKGACSLSPSCPVHPVWIDVRTKVEKLLEEVNFGVFTPDRGAEP
jgi:Rrf2 family protein